MMKNEFEAIIESTVSDEDYALIEFVYMWHPAISNENGKLQMAGLYKAGGMAVINDMYKRAEVFMDLTSKMEACRERMSFLQEKMVELAHCPDVDVFEIEFKKEEVSKRA